MVLAVLVQHVVVEKLHEGRRAHRSVVVLGRRHRVCAVADEPLVVQQDARHVVVAGDEPDPRPSVNGRLEVHRVVLAHRRPHVMRTRDERVTRDVVAPFGLRGLVWHGCGV
jgi:hypothetical protein